jgi:hypothetical protein
MRHGLGSREEYAATREQGTQDDAEPFECAHLRYNRIAKIRTAALSKRNVQGHYKIC